MIPLLLIAFGLAYWLETLSYLKRRWVWAGLLLLSCMGWLHLLDLSKLQDDNSLFARARVAIGAPSVGDSLDKPCTGPFSGCWAP